MSTFNQFAKNEDDSSENEHEWTRTFLKRDSGIDIGLGDKILVRDGELQGTKGDIVNFDDNGKTVMFKPTNLDDWDEVLGIDRSSVVKYVDPGDSVKIVEGKYQGYSGLVMQVGDDETMPTVRIDATKQEHQISTNHLKCIKPRDKDEIKPQSARRNGGFQKPNDLELGTQKLSEVMYKVGDIIIYNNEKTHAFVTRAEVDQVQVVNEHGRVENIRKSDITGTLPPQRNKLCKDSKGFALALEDVVKVTSDSSRYKDQRGIVKDICKANILFLWDKRFLNMSNGIFVEHARSVTH